MSGDQRPPPPGRPRDEPTPLWPRFVTWPLAVRVVLWLVGWPFILASRARNQPGTPRGVQLAAVVLAAVVGVPWLLAVAVLLASLAPADLDDEMFGETDVLFAPLDPETTPPAETTSPQTGSADADSPASPAPTEDRSAAGRVTTVERIVDGDTLWLDGLGERARLIGIDTPELSAPDGPECLAQAATDRLAELVPPGSRVRVTTDVEELDRYGRPLVYLHRADDDLFVNEDLVAAGLAVVSTHPPNVAHVEEFTAAQRSARDAELGVWSDTCDEPAAP